MSKSTSAQNNQAPAAKAADTPTQQPVDTAAQQPNAAAVAQPDPAKAADAVDAGGHADVRALAEKGEGVLTRFGTVWSYPGVDMDPSGSNLRLPIEHVSAAAVKAALDDTIVAVSTFDIAGQPLSVRIVVDGEQPKVLSAAQAGTPDAGTQLPPGSKPSTDAGAIAVSPEDAAREAKKNLETVRVEPDPKGDKK